MSDTAFRLSRVYAEGWNAAHRLSKDGSADLDSRQVETLNPYAAEPEKSRWSAGFAKAVGS
jgi:hypothetical protein